MKTYIFEPLKEIVHFYLYIFLFGLKEFGMPKPCGKHIILHSGRSCTKSTFFAMWNIFRMQFYEKVEGCVFVYEKTKIKKTVWMAYLRAIKYMKLRENIDYIVHEGGMNGEWYILIKCQKHNCWNKIVFYGCSAGANSFKGLEPTMLGYSFLFGSFFEIDQFVNWQFKDFLVIQSSLIRSACGTVFWDRVKNYCNLNKISIEEETFEWLTEQDWFVDNVSDFMSNDFCFEYEFNTPKPGPSWWVMDWVKTFGLRPDVWYQFNNYLDMTEREKVKFLKPSALAEIEELKKSNPIEYQHEWLGMEDYNGDITFPNLSKEKNFGVWQNFKPDVIAIGIDTGTADPTVCVAIGIEYHKKDLRLQEMSTWFYGAFKRTHNRDDRDCVFNPDRVYTVQDYGQFIRDFCTNLKKEYPDVPQIKMQIDRRGSGKAFFQEVWKYGRGIEFVKKPKNNEWDMTNIPEKTRVFNSLITGGLIKFKHQFTFNAFKVQINDSKKESATGEIRPLDNYKKPSLFYDVVDAATYCFDKHDIAYINKRIRHQNGKFNWQEYREQEFYNFCKNW